MFDINKEDLRKKSRLVAGGHVIDSTMYQSYSSVVQTRTVRILETIAMNEGMDIVTGDISNAFEQAFTDEKIWSQCGKEFSVRENCAIQIRKVLYGLSTSARQWSLAPGDLIRGMSFTTSHANPDLWIRSTDDNKTFEYIASHVDDVIIVSESPGKYIEILKQHFPIRNIEINPTYYLGNELQINDKRTIKVGMNKYITEVI